MANKILVTEQDGTPKQIVFANHAGDFAPAAANDLRITTDASKELDAELILASLADAAARQSAKVDLGADRAAAYKVRAAFEMAATPTAGEVIEFYWGVSQTTTSANGNPANLTGSDAAYAGYSSNLADSIKQLDFIGNFIVTVQVTGIIQVVEVGILVPSERHGILVIKNESGAAFHSDDVESHVVLTPIVDEIQ